jgi:hypothetical protein
MRGLRFRAFGVFAGVLAAACLLLIAVGDIVDTMRGTAGAAEALLPAAIATITPAAHGIER